MSRSTELYADTRDIVLPITAHRDALVTAVQQSRCLVIIGDTGSGKTTQLPQYLLAAGYGGNSKPIAVTQPRRVAAISVAERVAHELHVELGKEVGYQVRFDSCCSSATKIKFLTDGCLLRECLEDENLSKYSVVILDEAHVRSLDTDILFGLVRRFLDAPDPSTVPKLIVMSATLESGKFAEFFNCNVFLIPGRVFPVHVNHCDLIGEKDLQTAAYVHRSVEVAMDIRLDQPPGDILIFLTGQAEIDRACKALFERSEAVDYRYDVMSKEVSGLLVVPVYGSLPTAMQKRVFAPAPEGVRKIIVATDIASTSLTIDGIVYVVDSGFVKQKEYNPSTGLDSLQVVPISRSEARQRSGRAGRTRAGEAFRLYSKEFEESVMSEFTAPEIQRTSLTTVVLTLKSLNVHNVIDFAYLDKPSEKMLLDALHQLFFYDALDRDGKITDLGRRMSAFPLAPSLARVLLYAFDTPYIGAVVSIVAMLSVESLFIRPGHPEEMAAAGAAHALLNVLGGDDFSALLYIFQCYSRVANPKQWCRRFYLHFRALQTAIKVREQLVELLQDDFGRHAAAAASGMTKTEGQQSKRDFQALLNDDLGAPASDAALKALLAQHHHHHAHNHGSSSNGEPLAKRSHASHHHHQHHHQQQQPSADELLDLFERGMCGAVPAPLREAVARALCVGYFNKVARRAGAGGAFRVMDGHGSTVLVHPASALRDASSDLEWVVFHEVVWTTKPFMRTLCPVQYAWVKDLLPKLHQADIHALSGTGRRAETLAGALDATADTEHAEALAAAAAAATVRRNTDADVAAARERFLARKKATSQIKK